MNPIEIQYRDHQIVIRDEIEFPSNVVTGTVDQQPVTKRIIAVDRVDVTSRCRISNTDEEKIEAAKRFIDRVYPKGKSEPESKAKETGQSNFHWS